MKIYIASFKDPVWDYIGVALCEDGVCLCQHSSSSIGYSRIDMGMGSSRKHDIYREHCPNGYELEWVDDPEHHDGWKAAEAIASKNGRTEDPQ